MMLTLGFLILLPILMETKVSIIKIIRRPFSIILTVEYVSMFFLTSSLNILALS